MERVSANMDTFIRQLKQWWRQARPSTEMPTFTSLWRVALAERNRVCRRWLSDEELMAVVYDRLRYCAGKFNPQHPPRSGVSRRGTADRLLGFFGRALRRKFWDEMR